MNLIARLVISTLAVLVTSYILGVHIENFLTAIMVAIVLGCLNTFLKPLLILFSLPAVVFSFGLFLIVINTFIILLADRLIDGFEVNGLGRALLFSIVMWVVTGILNSVKNKDKQEEQ